MNYKQRIGMSPSMVPAALTSGGAMAQQTVGGNFATGFQVGGSATGPALVLTGLVILLVLDYVWTRGQQGGR